MRILAATDFSPCSAGAVRLATSIAGRRGASLLIVHAIESPRFGDPILPIAAKDWETNLLTAAQEAIEREAKESRQTGVSVATDVLAGDAARIILDLARENAADLIVMGTHGRKGGARLLLGSVAETVVRSSACPVLVARDAVTDLGSWEGRRRLRLAVATDGSAASQSALTWAGQFARGDSCDLSLVRFYVPSAESVRYGLDEPWKARNHDSELLSLITRDFRRDARSVLGEVPERVRLRAIAHEGASDALGEESARVGADAVVLGVPRHRRKGWTAIAPSAVLRSSRLPIVCVPEAPMAGRHQTAPVRSILVAVDLSDISRDVVAPAYSLLRAQGGRVELCTVHEVGAAVAFAQIPLAPPLGEEERTDLESRLRALVPDDADRAGITTHISVIEGARAAQAILATAARMDVDVIAVGSHGRTGFSRAVLGSVAEEVARNATRPVLLVRDRADRGSP